MTRHPPPRSSSAAGVLASIGHLRLPASTTAPVGAGKRPATWCRTSSTVGSSAAATRRHCQSLILLVTVWLAIGCAQTSAPSVSVTPPDDGYLDLELPLLGAMDTFRLGELAGSPVVVNFFASWCAPCVQEMPEIEEVKQQVDANVRFVGVNVQDPADAGLELVERTGITWQVVRDPDGALIRAIGGRGMPTTVLLAPDGSIAASVTGALSAPDLRALLADALDVEVLEP